MPANDQKPSILEAIETADTPSDVINALGGISLRRIMTVPLRIGHEILDMVASHGNPAEIIGSSANHL